MVVGRDYLLRKPSGPSAAKLFLDTRVVPGAVNLAGGLEVALDRASVRAGIRPAMLVAGLAGSVGLAAIGLYRVIRDRDRAGAPRA